MNETRFWRGTLFIIPDIKLHSNTSDMKKEECLENNLQVCRLSVVLPTPSYTSGCVSWLSGAAVSTNHLLWSQMKSSGEEKQAMRKSSVLWLSLRQRHWYSGKQSTTVGHDVCWLGVPRWCCDPADPLELRHCSEGLHLPKAPAGVWNLGCASSWSEDQSWVLGRMIASVSPQWG